MEEKKNKKKKYNYPKRTHRQAFRERSTYKKNQKNRKYKNPNTRDTFKKI